MMPDLSFAAPPPTEQIHSIVNSLHDVAREYDPSAEGEHSRRKLIALAKDLIKAVRNPFDMAEVHMANEMELVCIRTCLELRVFHAIPFPGSISLSEIAAATGATEPLLERLLRMLVCTGFLESSSPRTYSHSRASFAYTLHPGPGDFFQLVYDESFLMIDDLHLYLSQKGLEEPQQQEYSPYARKSHAEGFDIYDTMAKYPARFAAFQRGLAHGDASIPLLGFYDFSQLNSDDPERPILVDVGGGAGHTIAQILNAYPELKENASRFVLQDKPAVLKKAAENEALLTDVVQMPHDFWTEQPVKGARAYFLRRILHDFSDVYSAKILSQIVPAMSHDSRILIADLMFPSEHVTANDLSIATFDITMFNMGGKERSESGFRMLLENVGCELVQVWRSETGFGVIVEGRLKGSAERVVDEFVTEEKVDIPHVEGASTATPAVCREATYHDAPTASTELQATSQDGPTAQENGNNVGGDLPINSPDTNEAENGISAAAPAENGTVAAVPDVAEHHPNGVSRHEHNGASIDDSSNGPGGLNGPNGNDGR